MRQGWGGLDRASPHPEGNGRDFPSDRYAVHPVPQANPCPLYERRIGRTAVNDQRTEGRPPAWEIPEMDQEAARRNHPGNEKIIEPETQVRYDPNMA